MCSLNELSATSEGKKLKLKIVLATLNISQLKPEKNGMPVVFNQSLPWIN